MADDIRVRFGLRVRDLRRQRGWTQVEFAEKLGMDRSYLADVERGKRNISLLNIDLLSKGFGLSLARFFSRL